jgi:hypothetical protein
VKNGVFGNENNIIDFPAAIYWSSFEKKSNFKIFDLDKFFQRKTLLSKVMDNL